MPADKLDRLKNVLDAYGADPARWPDADRAELADLLEAGSISASERQSSRETDQVLAGASSPALPAGARARLLQAARDTPQSFAAESGAQSTPAFGVGRFVAVSTLAASLLIGVFVGTFGNLDSGIWGEGSSFVAADDDGFEDPFDLDSLVSDVGEETG